MQLVASGSGDPSQEGQSSCQEGRRLSKRLGNGVGWPGVLLGPQPGLVTLESSSLWSFRPPSSVSTFLQAKLRTHEWAQVPEDDDTSILPSQTVASGHLDAATPDASEGSCPVQAPARSRSCNPIHPTLSNRGALVGCLSEAWQGTGRAVSDLGPGLKTQAGSGEGS